MPERISHRQRPPDTDEQLLRAWGWGLEELAEAVPEELVDPWITRVFNPDDRAVDAMTRLGFHHTHAIGHVREALDWARTAQAAIVPTDSATVCAFADCVRILARRIAVAADSIAAQQSPPSENQDDNFVPIMPVWRERFGSYRTRDVEAFFAKHPGIRQRRPRSNRREVHAADWARYWAQHDRIAWDRVDEQEGQPSVVGDDVDTGLFLENAAQMVRRTRAKKARKQGRK